MSHDQFNEEEVLNLLSIRHRGDVFIPQCRTGPSFEGVQIFDAWVVPSSWSTDKVFGYEVKVSRNDFLRDSKWQGYLPFCTDFYFVCPWKMISVDEVPEPAGLIWCSKNATRLYTKKQATHRDVEIPKSIFKHALMKKYLYQEYDEQAYWDEWLAKKKSCQLTGHMVGCRLSRLIMEVHRSNLQMKRRLKQYKKMRRTFKDMGWDPEKPYTWKPPTRK